MRPELIELASEVLYRPDKVNSFLDVLMESTGTNLAVLLASGRSDQNPEYRRVTIRGDIPRWDLGSLLGGSDVVLSWKPTSLEPSTVSASELGCDWDNLFHGSVLVLPLPGRPLGYKTQAPLPLAGLLLLGPGKDIANPRSSTEDLLLATQTLLAVSLVQWERRDARRMVAQRSANWQDLARDADVQTLGTVVLERVCQVVNFHTGVLYLRGLPSLALSDYMVFAASIGEDDSELLHSYWASEQLGITFATMTKDRRTVAGKKGDMPEARRATNDRALSHVPGGVHGAWALMPFFAEERGVAVAHLEGINDGRGVTRTELEALQLLGDELGEIIHDWQSTVGDSTGRVPDLSLVEQLYEVQRYDRNVEQQRAMFEDLVRRAFLAIPGITNLSTDDAPVRLDCHFVAGETRVVVEATLSKDLTEKRRQLLEYVTQTGADLGILVVGRTVGGTDAHAQLDAYSKMLLMDSSRLMRFVCLSPKGRNELLSMWVKSPRTGMQRAPMVIGTVHG